MRFWRRTEQQPAVSDGVAELYETIQAEGQRLAADGMVNGDTLARAMRAISERMPREMADALIIEHFRGLPVPERLAVLATAYGDERVRSALDTIKERETAAALRQHESALLVEDAHRFRMVETDRIPKGATVKLGVWPVAYLTDQPGEKIADILDSWRRVELMHQGGGKYTVLRDTCSGGTKPNLPLHNGDVLHPVTHGFDADKNCSTTSPRFTFNERPLYEQGQLRDIKGIGLSSVPPDAMALTNLVVEGTELFGAPMCED